MVENKSILVICLSVCICQTVLWRMIVNNDTREISEWDGIISDPRNGAVSPRLCPKHSSGNTTAKNTSGGNQIQLGGYFKPTNCQSRETVAVIVPYRDREEHLKYFLEYMHPFLQQQQLQYKIYVVEMAMPTTFNRGILVNIGVLEAMNDSIGVSCYVIHDVDLLPVDDRNLYVCSDGPRHMSTANSNYLYRLPYSGYVGGVISFTPTSFRRINGFSNLYFGWGGEDDDLRQRISLAGYTLQRVPEDIGTYNAMDHGADKHNQINRFKDNLLAGAKNRMKTDGLNSVKYKLLKREKRPLYTWIYVQVNQSSYPAVPLNPT